jgi:hypothetical protein
MHAPLSPDQGGSVDALLKPCLERDDGLSL